MFKIAIVGAGIIGKSHASAIFKNPDCELIAVCDVDAAKAEEVANQYAADCYTDYKVLAEEVKMDAVILNLPHFLHCEVAVYFLDRGINVLVEKPMANTTEECDRMIEAAKKSGAKLAVGHVQRYYSPVREAKEIIDSGKFGKLCMITEIRNVDYVTPGRPRWFLSKALAGGGILMNYGAHSLDRIMYATGCRVEKVYGITSNPVSDHDVDVDAQLLLKLTGGVSAVVTYCGNRVPGEYETSFYFTDGALKIKGGEELWVSENKQFVKRSRVYSSLLEEQLKELVKLLKGEENEIVTPEYGRHVIEVLEQVV